MRNEIEEVGSFNLRFERSTDLGIAIEDERWISSYLAPNCSLYTPQTFLRNSPVLAFSFNRSGHCLAFSKSSLRLDARNGTLMYVDDRRG
jgi:hypothetical protein